MDIGDRHWISAVTYLFGLHFLNNGRWMNMRVLIGTTLDKDPKDLVFPMELCHQTGLNLVLSSLTRFNCSNPIHGRLVVIEQFAKSNHRRAFIQHTLN